MIHLHIDITMPDDARDLAAVLQALRTWEGGREAVHLRIECEAPTLRVDEVTALYDRLVPPLPYRFTGPRAPEAGEGEASGSG